MLSFIQHDKVSNYDRTFHIKTGFCSKLHRDDREHTRGLNVNAEVRQWRNLREVTSRFVPMDLSYSGSDVSYPTLWTIRTQQIMTQNDSNKHKHLLRLQRPIVGLSVRGHFSTRRQPIG